jgi:hypothetical protein
MVLAAVVEVQVAVHDRGDVAFVDADGVKGFDDRSDLRLLVEVVDQWVAVADAGVEQDHAVGVPDHEGTDQRCDIVDSGMPFRQPHFTKLEDLDDRCHDRHDSS